MNELAVKTEWDRFREEQENRAMKSSRPTPDGVKLNGNTGKFSRSKWNKDAKKTEFFDMEPFEGVVLAVRFFVKWKFNSNAKYDIRSKEFSEFRDEPIELLKIDLTNRGNEPTTKTYADYADMKAQNALPDPMTGAVKSPFDLFVSLYVLTGGEVVRYRFKGDTRSAWFDFQGLYRTLPVIVTKFGVSEPKAMPARPGEEAKVYYSGTFEYSRDVDGTLCDEVMRAMKDMETWFAFWKKESPAAPVKLEAGYVAALPAPEDDEIRVEDIPF